MWSAWRRGVLLSVAVAGLMLCGAPRAGAVLLYATPQRNTWAPSGTLWNSGWQYEGRWGSFLGTPISPLHFVTASHVGGSMGQTFSYRGKTYTTRAMYDDPASDLRIWKVDRPFADAYAPIYRAKTEVGKQVVIYGRGTQRGSDVVVNNQRKGWRWGAFDGQQSWGTNNVTSVVQGGSGIGAVLQFTFDATGGRNEGTLSSYDSGGGTFINENGTWKLAGVNFAAKGGYSTVGRYDAGFNASLYDEGGLWVGQPGSRWYVSDVAANMPGGGYVTRVSDHGAWIDSIIRPTITSGGVRTAAVASAAVSSVPEPGVGVGIGLLVIALGRRRRGV